MKETQPPGQTSPTPKTDHPSHKPAERSALAALDDLLHRLPPGDEALTQVEGLRDLLRGRAPAQSTRQKLKSVLDKLDYQRSRSKALKQELKALEEKKAKVERDITEADALLKSLEEEQTSLCFMVGPDGQAADSEEEEDSEDPPGILSEEETAKMMQRMNPTYLNRMLQAEVNRLRGVAGPGGNSAQGDMQVEGGGDLP